MPLRTLALLSVLLSAPLVHAHYDQRWFYVGTNLQVEKNADELVALIARAAKAGYNGLILADYKLHILDRVPRHYFTNLEKVKKAAAAAKIEIIPAVCPVGYSSGILAHDPNLAEGLPVREVPFRVEKGVATLVPFDTGFRNGNLETAKGDRFAGWGFQDDPGVKTFADRAVVAEGKVAVRLENFRKGGKTPGQLLADNAKRCVEIVRKQSPKSQLLIWSDMFDPHHNAVDRYYAVNGSLKGSWEGLPADVVILNWNGGKAAQSLRFFAERGHSQMIAGFYDSPGTTGFTRWQEAAKGIKNVRGFVYTTWRKDYSRLEAYGKLMQGK
jgi:hypothetical protein